MLSPQEKEKEESVGNSMGINDDRIFLTGWTIPVQNRIRFWMSTSHWHKASVDQTVCFPHDYVGQTDTISTVTQYGTTAASGIMCSGVKNSPPSKSVGDWGGTADYRVGLVKGQIGQGGNSFC